MMLLVAGRRVVRRLRVATTTILTPTVCRMNFTDEMGTESHCECAVVYRRGVL